MCHIFQVIFYTGRNHFRKMPWFLRVYCTGPLETLWEKEKLLVTSNFSFSHSVSYPFGELSSIFIEFEIAVCKLFQFRRVLKFAVWERVNLWQFENAAGDLRRILFRALVLLKKKKTPGNKIHLHCSTKCN